MVILLALTSTFPLNLKKLNIFCLKTAIVFIIYYLHKIVFHGYEIIEYWIVPLGLHSKEVQKSKNEDIRKCTENIMLENLLELKCDKKDSKRNQYPK